MKRIFSLLIIMFLFNISYAQRYEIGLFAGGNNVIGDIGSPVYVALSGATLGGLFKWNVDERLVLRGNLYMSVAHGDDKSSFYDYSNVGGVTGYDKSILNAEALVEWNFLPYNLRKNNAGTPYAFVGIGGIGYESILKIDSLGKGDVKTSIGSTVCIPFGVGYKYAITKKLVLAVDLSFRYTFSDNLDNSNYQGGMKPDDGWKQIKFGNLNSNDWFTTIGLTLTYVFGRDPCACSQ
jgi:hypothetical protein